jgi:hypothetical protein
MNTSTIALIAQVPIILQVSDSGDELVTMLARMHIDGDGRNENIWKDPAYQHDTYLQHDGKALDAINESYIVVPPQFCKKTRGVVFGSLALVQNINNNRFCFAVVGDLGPDDEVGEASPKCAEQVGVDSNARDGGTDQKIIRYTIFVGVPARVDGIQYVLQKFGG